jgi:hypothetical protein
MSELGCGAPGHAPGALVGRIGEHPSQQPSSNPRPVPRCAAKGTGQAGARVAQGQDGSGPPLTLGHKTNTRSHRAATVTERQTPRARGLAA